MKNYITIQLRGGSEYLETIELTDQEAMLLDVSGNIDLNSDSHKIKIGAGDDFQLYHDGSNNYIFTNNGDIIMQTSGDDIQMLAEDDIILKVQGGVETAIKAIGDGAVELYHNNVKTVETSSSHLQVFGNNAGNHAGIKVRNTNTGNSSRAEIRLEAENNASFATIFCDHQNTNL